MKIFDEVINYYFNGIEPPIELYEEALDVGGFFEFHNYFVKAMKAREKKKHPNLYMLTLTLRDCVVDALEVREPVQQYITQLLERDGLRMTRLEYCVELTKAGIPHWHVLIETTISLNKRHFEQYQKQFGNFDLSLSNSKKAKHIENYMLKENNIIIKLL